MSECLKSELVKGQMGQNHLDFGHVQNPNIFVQNPNNLVQISNIFRSDFRQLGLKAQTRLDFGQIWYKFKAQMSEIGTCQNPNQQKFRFRCFSDFGRSDFGIPLYI